MLQLICCYASKQASQARVRWLMLGLLLIIPIVGYLFLAHTKSAQAFGDYRAKIPNHNQGTLAANDCGACHGGTQAMKAPFANAGHQWTSALAFLDSDGDGFTNGEELQDPMGVWTNGASGTASAVTNPSDATGFPVQAKLTGLNGLVTGGVYMGVVNLSVTLDRFVGARQVKYDLLDAGFAVVNSVTLATNANQRGGYTPDATPFNLAWDTVGIPNGAYTMRATLTDAKNRASEQSIANITLNNPPVTNGTRYVAVTGADSGDCKDKAAPCKTPLYAQSKALAGDELRIAAGTYLITSSLGLYLFDPVTVTGGFTLSNWITPNVTANPTILDGGQVGHVVFVPGGGNGVIIQNVTIQNGVSAYVGIEVNGAPVLFRNCIFRDNQSSDKGGALQVLGGKVEIQNSRFERNSTTSDGGAIWASGPLTVTNSQFISNVAQADGGAVHVGAFSVTDGLYATGNLFYNNHALSNGGAVNLGFTLAEFHNNRFLSNQADGSGGAIRTIGPGIGITNTLFANNQSASEGAALASAFADRITLTHVTIAGADAPTAALAFDNTNFGDKPFRLVNTLISGYGTAIYLKARATDGASLIWQNSQVADEVGTPVENVNNSPIVGAPIRGVAGFVDAQDGNYHLTFGAPAIDAGDVGTGVTTDIEGASRATGPQPDIGAYEFQGPTGALTLSSNGYTPVQNSSFPVTVTLSHASVTPVTVQVSSADNTAQAGIDYTAVNETLTFAPGQTRRTVTVQILNSGAQVNRSFTLTLSAPTGGALLGAPGAATVTIAGLGVATATPTTAPSTSTPTATPTPTPPPGATATATGQPNSVDTPTPTPTATATITPTPEPGATRSVYLPAVTK